MDIIKIKAKYIKKMYDVLNDKNISNFRGWKIPKITDLGYADNTISLELSDRPYYITINITPDNRFIAKISAIDDIVLVEKAKYGNEHTLDDMIILPYINAVIGTFSYKKLQNKIIKGFNEYKKEIYFDKE